MGNTAIKAVFPLLLVVTLILAGCGSSPSRESSLGSSNPVQAALRDIYSEWRGVPYRNGGMSKKGIDCSGLVYLAYRDLFRVSLPRSTWDQARVGNRVKSTERRSGDLVFFKISVWGNHVGIYLGNNQFLHASASQGVMISRLDNPYWQKHYWKTVRPEPDYLVLR
ncbi:MAG: hypothetical protein CMK32_06160 [Porticoccaceae bacterium]|nr:hypothetical protein [Porticoccaceae bacterium]